MVRKRFFAVDRVVGKAVTSESNCSSVLTFVMSVETVLFSRRRNTAFGKNEINLGRSRALGHVGSP